MMEVHLARLDRALPGAANSVPAKTVATVVETPRGSRSKYDYDFELCALRLKKTLPLGMVFPFDFGFIPQTKAQDGDPLDIMILMDEPAPAGCIIDVRIIGAIEVEQRDTGKETGKDWIRNDRIFGVALASRDYAGLDALSDLGATTLAEIEAFFVHYNELEGKELRVIGRADPAQAVALIDAAAQ